MWTPQTATGPVAKRFLRHPHNSRHPSGSPTAAAGSERPAGGGQRRPRVPPATPCRSRWAARGGGYACGRRNGGGCFRRGGGGAHHPRSRRRGSCWRQQRRRRRQRGGRSRLDGAFLAADKMAAADDTAGVAVASGAARAPETLPGIGRAAAATAAAAVDGCAMAVDGDETGAAALLPAAGGGGLLGGGGGGNRHLWPLRHRQDGRRHARRRGVAGCWRGGG
ncbi:hypothetical protein I4F81_001860 [Pyropia yezoensis]|uniref:Uncharacterized protein n=1 Tax=Pyropia yezoensis TaxID=2788 RepID=A0ACC3BNU8_PYRYE|nr:hypothetical protein I4F81_001860 [Neopyropia yezoensis]